MNNPYEKLDDYGLRYLLDHLISYENWEDLERFLTDICFIDRKCSSGMAHDLIRNYETILNTLHDLEEEKKSTQKRDYEIEQYIKDLIAFAKGETRSINIIPSLEPWSDKKLQDEAERIKNNPTRLDRISAFSKFVSSEIHGLASFSSIKGFSLQQAYNSSKSSPVSRAADDAISRNDAKCILLLRPLVWRPEYNPNPALLKTLEGHEAEINCVAISLEGKKAISGSGDKTLRVWDIENGECIWVLNGHPDSVTSVNLTADGKKAISGSGDKTLRVWDLEEGNCVNVIRGPIDWISNISITPDGRIAASVSGSPALGSKIDQTLRVWDLQSGECIRTLPGLSEGISCVSISANGKIALVGSTGRPLLIYNIETGKCIGAISENLHDVPKVEYNWISCISVTPEGRRAISGGHDNTVRIWDLSRGKWLGTLKGHTDEVTSVCITPDGKKAVSGSKDKTLRFWDLECKKCLKILKGHSAEIRGVSITGNGTRAVSCSGDDVWNHADKTVRVWDLERGVCSEDQESHSYSVNSISISRNGKRAVSGSGEELLQHSIIDMYASIDPEEWQKRFESNEVSSLVMPISQLFEEENLRVWDLEGGICLRSGNSPKQFISSVCLSPDGTKLISGGGQEPIRVWDSNIEKCHYSIKAQNQSVTSIDISPDGRLLVSGGMNIEENLQLWDLEIRRLIWRIKCAHQFGIFCVKFTPDGNRIISGGGDRLLKLWDIKSGKCIMILQGHSKPIVDLCITPDGKIAVSGSTDRSIRVWNLESGKCLKILEGHNDAIKCVGITNDGRRAISGSWDKTLRVWDLQRGECIAVYQAKAPVSSISEITSLGDFAFGTSEGEVIFITPRNLSVEHPLITPIRIWINERGSSGLFGKIFGERVENGNWDDGIKASCPWCNQRSPVPENIIKTIIDIHHQAKLSLINTHCLELPLEAWYDERLLFKCDNCALLLKSNPFIVDNSAINTPAQ